MSGSTGITEFLTINERRFPLQVNTITKDLLDYYRWEHRATVGYRGRRFMICIDNLANKAYIEEITDGHTRQVKDQELLDSLIKWAQDNQFLNILIPMMKPKRFV